MPRGYLKNVPGRLGAKERCGSHTINWCRCSSCSVNYQRALAGIGDHSSSAPSNPLSKGRYIQRQGGDRYARDARTKCPAGSLTRRCDTRAWMAKRGRGKSGSKEVIAELAASC